jgi:hypothetical protein
MKFNYTLRIISIKTILIQYKTSNSTCFNLNKNKNESLNNVISNRVDFLMYWVGMKHEVLRQESERVVQKINKE